jgi:hypothetical protein
MVTKGYVIRKSPDASNKYLVRIPLFESSGVSLTSNDLNSSITECTLSHNPGTYEALVPGDCVFVTFEDNLYSRPVIIGKLFVKVEEQSSGYQYNTDLRVTHKATLPNDTTIGNVPFDNVLNYFNSINESIDRLSIATQFANIILYPTTASADVSGYFKMVTNIDDPSYNTTAVDITTGLINTDDQLLASLISEPNVLVGNPGIINITTIGNIRKTVGNSQQYAAFYFKVFKRSEAGVETLIATSDETSDIIEAPSYQEFRASALLNNGIFLNTDRIVIKYYADLKGNVGSSYDFQFGGTSPVRTLFPVPTGSIPIPNAESILTDTSTFNNILSSSDNNVQDALETLDNHTHNLWSQVYSNSAQTISTSGNTDIVMSATINRHDKLRITWSYRTSGNDFVTEFYISSLNTLGGYARIQQAIGGGGSFNTMYVDCYLGTAADVTSSTTIRFLNPRWVSDEGITTTTNLYLTKIERGT